MAVLHDVPQCQPPKFDITTSRNKQPPASNATQCGATYTVCHTVRRTHNSIVVYMARQHDAAMYGLAAGATHNPPNSPHQNAQVSTMSGSALEIEHCTCTAAVCANLQQTAEQSHPLNGCCSVHLLLRAGISVIMPESHQHNRAEQIPASCTLRQLVQAAGTANNAYTAYSLTSPVAETCRCIGGRAHPGTAVCLQAANILHSY